MYVSTRVPTPYTDRAAGDVVGDAVAEGALVPLEHAPSATHAMSASAASIGFGRIGRD
jgi:hypothetical protein